MLPLNLKIQNFPKDFEFYNGQFPPLDALTYWHFLQDAETVIEVGCGYSTLLPLKAKKTVHAIDPSPRIKYSGIDYEEKEVQHFDSVYFSQLKDKDILFIDSSHIYKPGSDVEYLINQVIPNLNEGVLVHFHDYFGEDNYPVEWQVHPEMKDWNENSYVLNLIKDYEILAFNHQISKLYNDELKAMYPFVPQDIIHNLGAVKGASLWFKNKKNKK